MSSQPLPSFFIRCKRAIGALWLRMVTAFRAHLDATSPLPTVIVDDALYAKQNAVIASLERARLHKWLTRMGVRLCFLLSARLLENLKLLFAGWSPDAQSAASFLLLLVQGVLLVFAFWSWTDRFFARLFESTARRSYTSRLHQLGFATEAPEYAIEWRRLQVQLVKRPIDAASAPLPPTTSEPSP